MQKKTKTNITAIARNASNILNLKMFSSEKNDNEVKNILEGHKFFRDSIKSSKKLPEKKVKFQSECNSDFVKNWTPFSPDKKIAQGRKKSLPANRKQIQCSNINNLLHTIEVLQFNSRELKKNFSQKPNIFKKSAEITIKLNPSESEALLNKKLIKF